MSESAVKKPVLTLTTTTDIHSSGHGVLRFRKWMAGDSAAIRMLSREELGPREFAERLLALQSIEPRLTPKEIKDWDDAELMAVVHAWWEEVDRSIRRRSRLTLWKRFKERSASVLPNRQSASHATSVSRFLRFLNSTWPRKWLGR